MAMAAALVATLVPSSLLHPSTGAAAASTLSSGPRNAAIEQHGSRGISVRLGASWDCYFSSSCSRGPSSSESVAAADSGLSSSSSSGRDGGAAATTCSAASVSRPSGSSRRNAAAADRLVWRACSGGGLMRLDFLSGLSAAAAASARGRTKHLPAAAARRSLPLRIVAEKPDLTNVAGTLLRLGKQGLEAGTKLVPESVPRPVAQAGVGLAGVFLASFLLKSLFSTVTFILAIGALSYAGYFFLTKGESTSSSGKGGDGSSDKPKSTDEALEEARRIMEKYK